MGSDGMLRKADKESKTINLAHEAHVQDEIACTLQWRFQRLVRTLALADAQLRTRSKIEAMNYQRLVLVKLLALGGG